MDKEFSTIDHSEVMVFIFLAAILSFLLFISFIFGLRTDRGDSSVPSETASRVFPNVLLKAKAVYVYDIRMQNVMFSKNENLRLPLASLTKIMSALVASDLSPMHSVVTISGEALRSEGDSGLFRGEKWSLKDLIDFSLITSSNDGMRAVALSLGSLSQIGASPEEIINDFVGEMNNKASEIGLKNTYFWNETGLDIPIIDGQIRGSEVKGGAYGTAKDMSSLLEYILMHNPELFLATRESITTLQSLDNHLHIAKNTNNIVSQIPRLMASKTGFTDIAGGNLVFIFDPEIGRPIIVSIIASTETGRFEDALTLVKAVMEYIGNDQQNIYPEQSREMVNN